MSLFHVSGAGVLFENQTWNGPVEPEWTRRFNGLQRSQLTRLQSDDGLGLLRLDAHSTHLVVIVRNTHLRHSFNRTLTPIGGLPEELEVISDYDFEKRVMRFAGEGGNVLMSSRVGGGKGELRLLSTMLLGSYSSRGRLYTGIHVHFKYHLTLPSILHKPSLSYTKTKSESRPPSYHWQLSCTRDKTTYEVFHAVFRQGLKPLFDAFVSSTGGGAKDIDTQLGFPMTKINFAEFELSSLHLQQAVEIPEEKAIIHAVIPMCRRPSPYTIAPRFWLRERITNLS
ncbi:dynein heavy chain [Marasmius crinis-equi]|uniref:Dynein heavy chain n=1 Tax=Marasmius crinis-equi TaxID=585013 RepID=A0ABR3F0L5_9AGAR